MWKKFILLFFLIFSSFCYNGKVFSQNLEWQWVHPYPYGYSIYYAHILNPDVYFIAGARGWFLKTTNAGQNWFQTPYAGRLGDYQYSLHGQIFDGHVFDENNIILAGQYGATRTTNGGLTFSNISGTELPNSNITDVFFLNDVTGYMCGNSNYLRKSTNSGASWNPVNTGFSGIGYLGISTYNDTLVVAVTGTGSIIRTSNGGNNWTQISTGSTAALNAVNFLNKDTIVASGSNDRFIISTNGGLNWINRNPGIEGKVWGKINVVNKIGYKEIYISGNNLNILKTTNLGVNWESVNMISPGQQYFSDYGGVSVSETGNTILAGGLGTLMLRQNDSVKNLTKGVRFSNIPGLTQSNNGLEVRNSGMKIWTVGEPQTLGSTFNQILYSSNGGNNWIFQPISNGNLILYDIQMIDDNTGFIVGSQGSFLKTSNGGNNWEISSIPTPNRVTALNFANANTGWVFGIDSALFKTTNAGVNWVRQKATFLNGTVNFHVSSHIELLNENTGWICGGTFGGSMAYINKTTNGGINWLPYPINAGIQAMDICMLNANTGYLSAAASKLRKTTDGGVTWDTLFIPFPPEEYDFKSIDFFDINNGVTIDNGGATLITTNGGSSWIFKLGVVPSNYMDVKMIAPFPNPLIFAVGGYSSVFRLGDNITNINEYSEWSNTKPINFSLYQNYPNPFNPSTKIQFNLPKSGEVKLLIYDIGGRLVQTLIDGVRLNPGTILHTFDGSFLPSGVYFYSLIFDNEVISTKKMVLIK